jgi:hypothetical protein
MFWWQGLLAAREGAMQQSGRESAVIGARDIRLMRAGIPDVSPPRMHAELGDRRAAALAAR